MSKEVICREPFVDPIISQEILSSPLEQTTYYPEELQYALRNIPTIEQARKLPTEKLINVVKEKPYAMDLSDELRKIRSMKALGLDPEEYWSFFKAQSEYYANESYAKLGCISYEHQLVNDHGNLRLWIAPMGKSAKESYEEAALKGGPDWYRDRCTKETAQVDQWEALSQLYLSNKVFIDISPAPFDVPKEQLKGTMFGEHSFFRASQLVYSDNGVPYIYSRAFRTYIPPSKLEEAMQKVTGEKIPAWSLLGTMIPIADNYEIRDLRDDTHAIHFQELLDELWEETPAQERPSSVDAEVIAYEEMKAHYMAILPALRMVFDHMVQDRAFDEDESAFLQGLVKDFQTWEKMVQGKVSGDWDRQLALQFAQDLQVGKDINFPDVLTMLYDHYRYQEYIPATNSCGTGSGASIDQSDNSVLVGTSSLFTGTATYETLSAFTSKDKSVKISCPSCKKSYEYKISDVKRANRLTCRCGASTDCWEPIIAASLKQQNR